MNDCAATSHPRAAALSRSRREKLCRHRNKLREGGGGFIYELAEYARSVGVMAVFPCMIVGPKPLLNIQSGCSYKLSPVCTSDSEKLNGSALYVHTEHTCTPIDYLYCQSCRYTMPTEWHRFRGTTITNHLFGL